MRSFRAGQIQKRIHACAASVASLIPCYGVPKHVLRFRQTKLQGEGGEQGDPLMPWGKGVRFSKGVANLCFKGVATMLSC